MREQTQRMGINYEKKGTHARKIGDLNPGNSEENRFYITEK